MRLTVYCFLLLVLASCSVKPEPLNYGKDACHACKMTLVDKRFGGEILTKKGKIYKFDDVNCLVGFYKSGFEPTNNVLSILFVDFQNENTLIDATTSNFLVSDNLRTPMGSGIAVFSNSGRQPSEPEGKVEMWDEILKRF
jgi:copper chaperone NosL